MGEFKAIETQYKGYRFRSRTEARWAVALDFLEIPWEYEREGFVLSDGNKYLPDFWLPSQELWIEIKGQQPTPEEIRKCEQLRDGSDHPVLMLCGVPGEHAARIFCWDISRSSGGLSEWPVARIVTSPTGPLIFCVDLQDKYTLFCEVGMRNRLPAIDTDPKGEFTLHSTGVLLSLPGIGWFEHACEAGRSARFEFGETGAK